jgi:ketosteroid isomerase-like protein
MTKNVRLLLTSVITVILCLNLPAAAQKTSHTNHRKEIMQLLNGAEKAIRAKDLNSIMALYDADVIAYDIAPPLQYVGAAAYRKTWDGFLQMYNGPLDVEFRDLRLSFSGDLAVSYSLERISGTLKDGKHSDLWFRVSDVYSKKNGKWLIVHEHVSVPIDFATGKAALDLKP